MSDSASLPERTIPLGSRPFRLILTRTVGKRLGPFPVHHGLGNPSFDDSLKILRIPDVLGVGTLRLFSSTEELGESGDLQNTTHGTLR